MRQVVCLSGRRPVPLCSGAEQEGLYKSGNAQSVPWSKVNKSGSAWRTWSQVASGINAVRSSIIAAHLAPLWIYLQDWNDGYSNGLTNGIGVLDIIIS